jgi:hypothetical protein
MISRFKVEVLRRHILGQKEGSKKPFAFRPKFGFHLAVVDELESMGFIEVVREEDRFLGTSITPKGVLGFLRAVGNTVGKKSGRDYFRDFINRNPSFLGKCGPIQRVRVEKYLLLGFMPPLRNPSALEGMSKETTP